MINSNKIFFISLKCKFTIDSDLTVEVKLWQLYRLLKNIVHNLSLFSASSVFSRFLFRILKFYPTIPSTKFKEEDSHSFMHTFIHLWMDINENILCVRCYCRRLQKMLNKVSQVLVFWNLNCCEENRQYTIGWSDIMHVKHLSHGLAHNKSSIHYCYHYLLWQLLLDGCS